MLSIVNLAVLALLVFGALALSSSGSVLDSGPERDGASDWKKPQNRK